MTRLDEIRERLEGAPGSLYLGCEGKYARDTKALLAVVDAAQALSAGYRGVGRFRLSLPSTLEERTEMWITLGKALEPLMEEI